MICLTLFRAWPPKRGGRSLVLWGDGGGGDRRREGGRGEDKGEREGGFVYIRTMDRAKKGKERGSVCYGAEGELLWNAIRCCTVSRKMGLSSSVELCRLLLCDVNTRQSDV